MADCWDATASHAGALSTWEAGLTKGHAPPLVHSMPSMRARRAVHASVEQPQHEHHASHGHAAKNHACPSRGGTAGQGSGAGCMGSCCSAPNWLSPACPRRETHLAVKMSCTPGPGCMQAIAAMHRCSPMGTIMFVPSLPCAGAGGAARCWRTHNRPSHMTAVQRGLVEDCSSLEMGVSIGSGAASGMVSLLGGPGASSVAAAAAAAARQAAMLQALHRSESAAEGCSNQHQLRKGWSERGSQQSFKAVSVGRNCAQSCG